MEENIEEKKIRGRQKSTKRQKVFMIIWILIFFVLVFEVIKLVKYTVGIYDKKDMFLYNTVNSIVDKIYTKKPNLQQEEKKINIATLGNIYLTPNITKGSRDVEGYNFTNGLEDIQKKLKEYDLVIANLATPIADKSFGYSTSKSYNAPEELLTTLKNLNISMVATATNHAMDKKIEGISDTLENLEKESIKQTGISNDKRSEPVILSKEDINIGVLSYTTYSNVKINEKEENLNIFTEEHLKEDIAFLKENNVDLIIAYINEQSDSINMTTSEQKKNIDLLFDNGVNIVLGGGIACVQDDYEDEIELSNNKKSHIYAIYSVGDFMGGYVDEYAKASIVPSFEITKTINKNKKGEVVNTFVDFKTNKPILTWTSVDKNYSKTMFLMEDEISNFNNDNSNLTNKEYKLMKEEYTRINKMYE